MLPTSAWHGSFPYSVGRSSSATTFCLFLNTGPGNAILANVVPAQRAVSSGFALNIFIVHLLGDAISPRDDRRDRRPREDRPDQRLATGFAVTSVVMAIGGVAWWWGARYLEVDTQRALDSDATTLRGFDVVVPPIVDEATRTSDLPV